MSKRKRHTQIAVNLSESCERFVPQKVKTQVNQFFFINGILCCPFQVKSFRELGISATYAHIVPKSEQTVLTKMQDVVNHPGNLVPTIAIIHEQMELHKTLPGFSLEYLHGHPEQTGKDVYGVRLAAHIDGEHILLKFLHANQEVIMPEASRQFWFIHKHVFDLCHEAKGVAREPQRLQLLLNTVLFSTVASHIALPIIQRLTRESMKEHKASLLSKTPRSMLSQQQVSFKDVAEELLAKRSFELRSTWFVLEQTTDPPPEYCNIHILWCSQTKRTFDIISKEDFVFQHEYKELIRIYKGRTVARFKNMIYVIHFDDLIKHLKPGSLHSLRSTWTCSTSSSEICGDLNFQAGSLPQVDVPGFSSSGDHTGIIHGIAFSRSQRKHSAIPILASTQKAVHITSSNSIPAQRAEGDECAQAHVSKRQPHKHAGDMLKLLGFTRGTLVVVSKSSKAHAGKVCVVENFEHLLDGRVSVFNVYLKTHDGNSRFRIASSFLQRCAPKAGSNRYDESATGDDA